MQRKLTRILQKGKNNFIWGRRGMQKKPQISVHLFVGNEIEE
jgi:hypothetical protein